MSLFCSPLVMVRRRVMDNHGFWFLYLRSLAVAASLPPIRSADDTVTDLPSMKDWEEEQQGTVTRADDATVFQDDDDGEESDPNTCGAYMAPSSIPGAGLGLYAGQDFDIGDVITPGDLVVPINDIAFHTNKRPSAQDFLWDE